MNALLKNFTVALLCSVGLSTLHAQQQPVMTVAIERINVGGTVDVSAVPFGTSFVGGTTFNPPNEAFGPAGQTINISAFATGTFLQGSFVYSFFVNGISIGQTSGPVAPPARPVVQWTPPQPGSYFLTVNASDGTNAAVSLPVRFFATGTVVNSPLTNTIVPNGSSVVLKADATTGQGFIREIQFYDNGVPIGAPDTTIPYSQIYSPPGAPGAVHNITAQARDNQGNLLPMSAPITLRIIQRIDPLPTTAISTPGNNSIVPISTSDTAIIVDAHSATGLISKVELYIDGVLFGTRTAFPYSFAWRPTVVGTYRMAALSYDDKNNVVASPVTTVVIATPPTVAVVSPTRNSTVTGGTPTVLRATATTSNFSAAGVPFTIESVQFFVDGTFVGQATSESGPNTYSINATLTQKLNEDGAPIQSIITAIATDSGGLSGISTGVPVNVTSGGTGTGGGQIEAPPVVLDKTVNGIISGSGATGTFVATNVRGKNLTFMGRVTENGVTRTYFFNEVPVGANGAFTVTDNEGRPLLNGTLSDTGGFGTLDNGRLSFSGALVFPGLVATIAPGYYTGNIEGRPSSVVSGIVAPDGAISLRVADGSFTAIGFGAVDASGNFDIATDQSGVRIAGVVNPSTGFLRASVNGGPGGTLLAATSGDTTRSDGFLRNLSTRGRVGAGNDTLVAGFVVGGTVPKQVLVRAMGPSLAAAGISAPLSNPYLRVLNSAQATVAENDNWETAIGPSPTSPIAVNAIAGAIGTGTLGAGSLDAAVLVTLAPGIYTAQVTGVGGATGIALVEVYDTDSQTAFSTQKLTNVSTRGRVSEGEAQLIAGFIVNGKRSKKVLIRAAGPSLGAAAPSLAGSILADPKLRLVRIVSGGHTVVRENEDWEIGNDVAQVLDVAAQSGAFAFQRGSKDAVILINLPAGVYTAHVTGPGSASGLALVEVYEVP